MELGKSVKLVIFDFDGTLFHLDIDWPALKESLGIADGSSKLGALLEGHTEARHPDLQKVTEAELKAVGSQRIDGEVADILLKLSKHYAVAILTRNSRYAVEKSLEGTIVSAIDNLLIIGREDVRKLKPHTEGLELIETQLDVAPVQAAVVGDTYHDVEVAQRNGAVSVIVHNPRLQYVPEGADLYIDSLSQLLDILDL